MNERWDVIVAGGGAAGLSAALMLGRSRRRVLVVDAGEPRNRFAAHMHGVLGNEGLDPAELLRRGRDEVAQYGVEVRPGSVEHVDEVDDGVLVRLATGESLTARRLIVATGLADALPEIPGLAERWGSTVLHCPYCHGWEVRDQRLCVVTTSPHALHQAMLVRQLSNDVTVFTAGLGELAASDRERMLARGMRLVDEPAVEVIGDGDKISAVRTADGQLIEADAIFTAGTARPHDAFLADLGLDRNETPWGSFLRVDATGKTSSAHIWAVGNVVDPGANVPISIGTGAMAGAMVNAVLVTEDFDAAVAASQAPPPTPLAYWQDRYTDTGPIWSGQVNATMADVARRLPVGRALDLGCGEGGDAVWLAEQGWQVTGVDISETAVARGAEGAKERGVADRIDWIAHDLSTWRTDESFDLVTASFFHSTVELPRGEILRRACERVSPGGHLLLVSHVFDDETDAPEWASGHGHHQQQHNHHHEDFRLLRPDEEIADLGLNPSEWQVKLEQVVPREVPGADGEQPRVLKDGVVLLQRK